jgi:MYXO-CTERM domain-containing protein
MPHLDGPRSARWTLALILAASLAAPVASAWSVDRTAPDPIQANFAAWTTDLVPSAFPGNAAAAVTSAVGCALGDVTGDGIADLLVLVADPAGGVQRLQALAGPGFEQVVWQKASSLGQVLQCAPDLDLDGTLDPILHTLGETTGAAAAGATDQVRNQVQQVLDGASGAALVGRVGAEQVTGVAAPVAGAAAGAAQQATSTLLPAAAGAAAFLQTEATTALLPIPAGVPLPLPIDQLTATATAAAELQILDSAGAVVATISIEEAGVQPLALAPVPLTGGLPDIAVLTNALSPVQEAAAGVPELALYAADGTLAWATQLPASTGLPILLPQAGDLNLDGVGDLVVTTVQQGVETAPGAAFHVLSGVDGSILFDSGPAVSGLLAALPLGELPDGAALLQVASQGTSASADLALSALDGTGKVLWSVDVSGLAVPVNTVLDEHTGDLVGFTDLTGDSVPDVAVAVQEGTGLALQVIDGLSGEVSVTASVADADRIVPVAVGLAGSAASAASGAAGQVAGLAGSAADGVQEVQAGATSALLALGTSATSATLTLIDPLTGAVEWVATAPVPANAALSGLSAEVAGDLDADGVQDLLVTASYNQTGSGQSAARGDGRSAQDTAEGHPGSVTAVSGGSGETLYAASAEPSGPEPLAYDTSANVGSASSDDGDGDKGIPFVGPGPVALALVLALGLASRRRR